MNTAGATTKITCDCTYCNGKAALVRGDGTYEGKPMSATMRHGIVCLAHSPLARARSAREFGPWAV